MNAEPKNFGERARQFEEYVINTAISQTTIDTINNENLDMMQWKIRQGILKRAKTAVGRTGKPIYNKTQRDRFDDSIRLIQNKIDELEKTQNQE